MSTFVLRLAPKIEPKIFQDFSRLPVNQLSRLSFGSQSLDRCAEGFSIRGWCWPRRDDNIDSSQRHGQDQRFSSEDIGGAHSTRGTKLAMVDHRCPFDGRVVRWLSTRHGFGDASRYTRDTAGKLRHPVDAAFTRNASTKTFRHYHRATRMDSPANPSRNFRRESAG